MITQEELKREVRYDPDTGLFWWIRQNAYGNRKLTKPVGNPIAHGYVHAVINGVQYALHRIAWLYMTGVMPTNAIDHINGDTGDNRWCNLREATLSENQQNKKMLRNNSSGFPGVSFHKLSQNWTANICYAKKTTYLGYYPDPLEAYFVYWLAKQRLHTFNPSVRAGVPKSAANPA